MTRNTSPEEQRLFRLYGKLPSRADYFTRHLKGRKYFDSGDYAVCQAGKGDGVEVGVVGSQHPAPENIPRTSALPNTHAKIFAHSYGTGATDSPC